MTENQRLKWLQKELEFGSQAEFAAALGMRQGSLSDVYRGKSGMGVSGAIKRTLLHDFGVRPDWLTTGVGEVFAPRPDAGTCPPCTTPPAASDRPAAAGHSAPNLSPAAPDALPACTAHTAPDTLSAPCTDGGMVPLLPLAAQGGPLNDFILSVNSSGCEKLASPIRGVDFAMSVCGDSMEPEYPNGSKVLLKRIDHRAFIEWGRAYVVDTCNGSVIKKVFPGSDPDRIRCTSVNPAYPPFEISMQDVYGLYRVLMLLSEK